MSTGVPVRIVGESDFMLMVGNDAVESAAPIYHDAKPKIPSRGQVRELTITLTPEASRINDLVERVKSLKRLGDYSSALTLLLTEIESQEQMSAEQNCGVAPWYYEQTAIIYRKLDDRGAEIAILERFAQQRHSPGVGPSELQRRLQKLKSREKF